jgi:hypothetical protein
MAEDYTKLTGIDKLLAKEEFGKGMFGSNYLDTLGHKKQRIKQLFVGCP